MEEIKKELAIESMIIDREQDREMAQWPVARGPMPA